MCQQFENLSTIDEETAREIGAAVISELLLCPRGTRIACLSGDKTVLGLGRTIARIVRNVDDWRTVAGKGIGA